ncbi:MAG TPA: cbb3-type cytochrome oxidase assembly protein CcoS [Nitrospirae bacterium]|nr:cbb3-type cytochrome oxidase assembly protein CcoS [Nitrospirota bacterium]
MWTVFLLIFVVFILGMAGYLVYIWAIKSGQYDDPEGPKYRMLDDEDEKG